jgi:hypothetical protein
VHHPSTGRVSRNVMRALVAHPATLMALAAVAVVLLTGTPHHTARIPRGVPRTSQ